MVSGHLKTIRYYPYYQKGFPLIKKLLRTSYFNAQGVQVGVFQCTCSSSTVVG